MRKSAPLLCALLLSLSARRAWIEICLYRTFEKPNTVALRKESVDRNFRGTNITLSIIVALRKESVDRNPPVLRGAAVCPVALRKESVDRNAAVSKPTAKQNVALRKESVDRNIVTYA